MQILLPCYVTVAAGCSEKCEIWFIRDIERMGSWVQHGRNPEARMILRDVDLVRSPKQAMEQVIDWIKRIHEYESDCGMSRLLGRANNLPDAPIRLPLVL